jgi:transposase
MQALLTIKDLQDFFRVSEPTIRRWLSEARKGEGNFPKPVNGFKRKLLFRPADVERWAGCEQQQAPVRVESAKSREKRHNAAMKRLQTKGVSVANTKQREESES